MTPTNEYLRQTEFRRWPDYLKELPSNRNSKILDLGCAVGTVTKLLGARYSKIIGIDRNTAFVNNANEDQKDGNVSFINGDAKV